MKNVLIIIGMYVTWFSMENLFSGEFAYSPKENHSFAWAPFLWEPQPPPPPGGFGSGPLIATLKKRISGDYTQGYTVFPFGDTTLDLDEGTCSRTLWDTFFYQNGVALVYTHGNFQFGGFVTAVTFRNRAIRNGHQDIEAMQLAKNWVGNTPRNEMQFGYDEKHDCWAVQVRSPWFVKYWKKEFDDNRSIVIISSCQSAYSHHGGNMIEACGGRVRFGYDDCPDRNDANYNLDLLLFRMSGGYRVNNDAPNNLRHARAAFTKGDFDAKFSISPQDSVEETSLCPAVARGADRRHLIEPQAGSTAIAETTKNGTQILTAIIKGSITFDTHIDKTNLHTENQLKDLFSASSFNAHVKTARWAADNGGDTKIEFELDVTACQEAPIELNVEAAMIMSEGGGKQRLDGGDIGDHPEWLSGVAPNANGPDNDDFVWKFKFTK